MTNNLTVDGSPYAPISVRKAVDEVNKSDKTQEFLVFISNIGTGFDPDNIEAIQITIQDRIDQTTYFVDKIFPKIDRIPAYLYRYIYFIMEGEMKYTTDESYLTALEDGSLNKTGDEYQKIESFIKWAKTNSEAAHIIGMIQLFAGGLQAAAKAGGNPRFFIELPETGLHPQREQRIMSLLTKIKEEYASNKD